MAPEHGSGASVHGSAPATCVDPTSFLDHVYLRCTQREFQISKNIVDDYKSMFESRISVGTLENYQKQKPQGNLTPNLSLYGRMTWKVMQRNAWKDCANWRIKQLNKYTKSEHHAWMTITLEKRNFS